MDSNLEHVSNKPAFLCAVMKTYRQKSRAGQAWDESFLAPDADKIRNKYSAYAKKTYSKKTRAGQAAQIPTAAKAPDEDKIKVYNNI
jgi:hypothetical protein